MSNTSVAGSSALRDRTVIAWVGVVGAAMWLSPTALAEDPAPETAPTEHPEQHEAESTDASVNLEPGHTVDLSIAPYIWMPSLSGNLKLQGVELDVDQTFLDTLDESEHMFGLMGAVDLNINRWVFQLNGAWTYSEYAGDRSVLRDVDISGDMTVQTLWMELFGGYRFIDHKIKPDEPASHRRLILDGFVGVRYTKVWEDGSLRISGDLIPDSPDPVPVSSKFDFDGSHDWFEPFLGLRFGYDLTEHWSVMIRGDVGGFGAGSDFAWQAFGGAGYRWYLKGWNIAAFGGFRALGQDYSDGGFTWDVITYGPIIGAQFSFAF